LDGDLNGDEFGKDVGSAKPWRNDCRPPTADRRLETEDVLGDGGVSTGR